MTDTDLNIAIAERKGWRYWLQDCTSYGKPSKCVHVSCDTDYSGNGWAEVNFEEAARWKPGLINSIPNHTADPREWAKLLEEMAKRPDTCDVELVAAVDDDTGRVEHTVRVTRWKQYEQLPSFYAAEPGRAVAEAWLACNDARSGEGE